MSETPEATSLQPKKTRGPNKPKAKPGRVFRDTKKVFHDLFKLHVANTLKNVSWQKDIINLQEVEHVHFFHSFDSAGVLQHHSTSIAGHFHIVEWEQNEDGPAIIKSISGPMVWGAKKDPKTGRRRRMPVPYGIFSHDPDVERDVHTHDFSYLESSELSVRKINVEATKVIGKVANTTSSPSWVKA